MIRRIFYFIIPFILVGILPTVGCGQLKKGTAIAINTDKTGYLGVEILDVDKKLTEKKDLKIEYGAYVNKVVEDSPAEEGGILKGDVIISINGKRVDDGEDLTVAVRKIKPKTEVKVEIIRKGEKKEVTVKIGKIKSPNFSFQFDEGILKNKFKNLKLPKLYTRMHITTIGDMSGLKIESMPKQLGEYFGAPNGKGVLVTEVEDESNADKAGFKAGDVIVKVNDSRVDDIDEFQEEFSDREGKEVSFEIIREKKSVNLKMNVEPEDKDSDEDEDNDDDWSMYYHIIPPDPPHPPHIEIIRPELSGMDALKARLIDLRYDLRDKIRHIREKVRDYVRNL